MSDLRKYIQGKDYFLSGSGVTSTATSITLTSFQFPDGTNITTSDIGSLAYGTFEPETSREENFSFTTITQNADGTATLSGVTRGLKFKAPYDQDTALRQTHAGGTKLRISNSVPFYDEFANTENDETVSQTWTFTNPNYPRMDQATDAPIDDEQLATKKYVDDTAGGTPVSINRVVVAGTAGETVSAGQVIYLDETDNEWKLADASTSATCDNVQLGIAQGAGTNGNPITGGVLVVGRDSNQSGLSQGNPVYVGDTAGAVVTSAGTVEVELGHAVSATEIDFQPKFASYTTKLQRDALAGTSGTPSASNKYVTNDDTTGTGSILRQTSVSLASGSDGSDGALQVTSGTTQIDLGSASVVVKNYTTFEISGTGKVEFINPASTGTTVIIRTTGDAILTSSQAPMLDLTGIGAAGGSGGAAGANGTNGTNASGIIDTAVHYGGNGEKGGAASTGGLIYSNTAFYTLTEEELALRGGHLITPGSGGGGGGGGSFTTGSAGGDGGRGGGALIFVCGGDINFTTANGISVDGADGSAAADSANDNVNHGAGGGGGGGAAGMAVILYRTATAVSGTITSAGGDGGDGGDATGASGGGGGEDDNSGAGGAGAGQYGGAGGAGGAGQTTGNNNGNNGSNGGGTGAGAGGGSGATQNYNTATSYTGGTGGTGGGNTGSIIAKNYYL